MLGTYDSYLDSMSPHIHQVDGYVAVPSGWVLHSSGNDIMQHHPALGTRVLCSGDSCTFAAHPSVTGMAGVVMETGSGLSTKLYNTSFDWDIKDVLLPRVEFLDKFELWPNGDCKFVYQADSIKARKHKCGWAMRNTNNHNKMILKKSCLGIIKCSKDCLYPDRNNRLALAPKISEGARRCQLNNKRCPNPDCAGVLVQQLCKGKSGNPVTHYWRFNQSTSSIYFMAKGVHDHSKPTSLLKLTDRKIKVIKREAEQEAQVMHPFGDRLTCKMGSVDVDINLWTENLVSISNDYDQGPLAQCDPLEWCSSTDMAQQQCISAVSYAKQPYLHNHAYHSQMGMSHSPQYYAEFPEDPFTSVQGKCYSPFPLKGEIKDRLGSDDSQWAADFVNFGRLPPLSYVNYNNNVVEEGSRSKYPPADELKLFTFYSE